LPNVSGDLLDVLILNWRDLTHPQGGGSELYAEQVAAGLSSRGHRVTLFCAAHPGAAADQTTGQGVRLVRAGGRLSVYAAAAWAYRRGRLGRPDVVVDVQNGVPFLARVWAGVPVVVLVHHVHREQWPVVMGPVQARIGWWIESRLATRVNRGLPYVTVSDVSRAELGQIGVDTKAVQVVRNGTPVPLGAPSPRSSTPRLVALGRLVPHKRLELALRATARLRERYPTLHLDVVGQGWWQDELLAAAAALGLGADAVTFTGFVDEPTKHRLLGRAWVSLVPSIKEGWGLTVMEAAAHGTPSVGFRHAGGVAESVEDGETGLLVDDEDEFVHAVDQLLSDPDLRERLGRNASERAAGFTWEATVSNWEQLLRSAVAAGPSATEGRNGKHQRVP
jgi:glycosyltransferase involved in cell wall biosynthesis